MKAVKFRLRDVGWHLYGFDQRPHPRDVVDDMEWLGKSRRFAFRRVNYIAALIAYAHLQINNDFEAVNVNGRTSRSIQPSILGRGCPITAGFWGTNFSKTACSNWQF